MIAHEVIAPIATLHEQLAAQPIWDLIADTEAIVERAITIQQIPAPTFEEHDRARYVQEQMIALGLAHVHTDELHNVYGAITGRVPGPGVVLTAHTDTVFPRATDLTVRRDAARIWGPGIADNSISVAALLHMAGTLIGAEVVPERTLWFVANTGEEGLGDLRGMRAAMDHLSAEIARVIVIDAEYGSIIHAGVASRRFRLHAHAPGGHSWQDFGARSAVHTLVRLAARICDLHVPAAPKTTFNIGVIEGGTSVNAIAQHASLLLDLRSVDQGQLGALVAQVETIIAEAAANEPEVHIRAEIVGDRPGGALPETDNFVQLAKAAYAATGATVTTDAASTDANVPLSRGVSAVCVGMSRGGNAHRLDEYLEIADIPSGMRSLLLLVLAAANGGATNARR